MFFRERRVSMERLREALRGLGSEHLLLIHVRGEISEELVHHIMETAKDVGIQRIKVEHIKRKERVERDQDVGMDLFLGASEGSADIYYKERSISLEQVQERLQAVDDPRAFVLSLHVDDDVSQEVINVLVGIARDRGVGRINVVARGRR
jgi:biopolymer transport protein ExbD